MSRDAGGDKTDNPDLSQTVSAGGLANTVLSADEEQAAAPRSLAAEQPVELALAGIAGAGLSAGDMLIVDKPDPGKFAIHDLAGKTGVRFSFNLADGKIIILDVDVVITFPDDSKIILPGMALKLALSEQIGIEFADMALEEQELLSLAGDVKLADKVPSMNLSTVETGQASDEEQESKAAEPPPPPPAPYVPPPLPNDNEGAFDEEPVFTVSNNEAVVEGSSTSSASASSSSSQDAIDFGQVDGAPFAALGFSILGVDRPVVPGMLADVDILTGRQTILSYLMKPLRTVRDNALRQ